MSEGCCAVTSFSFPPCSGGFTWKQQAVNNTLLGRHTQSNKSMGVNISTLDLCLKFESFCRVIVFLLSLFCFFSSFCQSEAAFCSQLSERLALFTMLHHMCPLHTSERANRCFIWSLTKLHKTTFYFQPVQSWPDSVHRGVGTTVSQMSWMLCGRFTLFITVSQWCLMAPPLPPLPLW